MAKSEQSSLTNPGGEQAAVEAWTVIRWPTDKGLVCAVRLNGARFLRNAGHQPKPDLVPLTEEQCIVEPMHDLHKLYLLLSKVHCLFKLKGINLEFRAGL